MNEKELVIRTLILCGLPALIVLVLTRPATAQERWFQIEVSVFSNERLADRNEELWQAESLDLAYPDRLHRLTTLLDALFIEELRPALPTIELPEPVELESGTDPETSAEQPPSAGRLENIRATGPFPPAQGEPYRFIDFARDPWLQLSMDASDFRQTNQALERSPEHRLLFHGLWRQPVADQATSQPVYVYGGNRYGEQFELQGSIAIYFNPSRDRVVAEADLWLSEFRRLIEPLQPPLDREAESNQQIWHLPPPPADINPPWLPPVTEDDYEPVRIYQLLQTREMRSTEFHYLDHPALGMVVMVEPYEVPPLPNQEETAAEQAPVDN